MDLCLQIFGLCCKDRGADVVRVEQNKINNKIERTISKSKAAMLYEQKILLLGTGGCGKSTFIKQMRIILGGGFPEDQYEYYLRVVHKNLLQAASSLTRAMDTLNIPYKDPSLREDIAPLVDTYDEKMDAAILEDASFSLIMRLWEDEGVASCYNRRREYQLLDSAQYFLDKVPDIRKAGFRVDLQDILRTRVKTTGIIEEVFDVGRINLRIIDVGGQRRERRKWIHSFEGVTSVIFLASLSEYDMLLEECHTRNRTEESLQLFKIILEYPWFRSASVILFLNKKDLFAEKVPRSYIGDYLTTFKGPPGDIEAATSFMSQLYQDCYNNKAIVSDKRQLFLHLTCATDTDNIRKVFANVKSTVLQKNINELNLN